MVEGCRSCLRSRPSYSGLAPRVAGRAVRCGRRPLRARCADARGRLRGAPRGRPQRGERPAARASICCSISTTAAPGRAPRDERPADCLRRDARTHRTTTSVVALADGRRSTFNDPRRFGLMHVDTPRARRAGGARGRAARRPEFSAATCTPSAPRGARSRTADGPAGRRRPRQHLRERDALRRRHTPAPTHGAHAGRGDARIVAATREILAEAIEHRGLDLRTFSTASARAAISEAPPVYDRAGEPCRRCGSDDQERHRRRASSFYCPQCQR